MKTSYKILLVCLGLVLLFIVGLSFEKLILESGNKGLTTSIAPQDNPPVEYNAVKARKLHEIFQNRPELSEADQTAKKMLAARKNPLQTTADYAVEYLSAPDEFMVEIKTTNIDQAKLDAVSWFESQGFTDEGICSLPVVFYLNYDVAQSLRGTDTEFNPLPPGC